MKKKLAFALCTALMLCSMSVAALATEPMTEADTVSTMISAADTLPGISAYPAEVRASEENGVYRLEKVYYLTAKDDPATIPTADFEREGRTYTLLDLLKNDQTETDTREHIEVVTLESKTKDMAEILKMLEPKLEVKTEDGYKNKIRYKKHLGTGRVYVDLRQQIVEINFSSPEKCNIREITYTLR